MIKPTCLLIFSLFTFTSFTQSAAQDYDYDAPKLIGNLPSELDEISGLSMSSVHRNELLAVQDEEGKIFRINAKTGALLFAVTFWKDGDYEAIEAVGSDVWVLKSTGTLYQVSNVGKADQKVEKFNTALTGDNDVEGLAYDARKNRLLLACKKDAKDDGNDKDGRYIYSFDLASKTLSKKPVFAIELEAVKKFLSVCEKTTRHEQLCDFFFTRDEYDLAPSAIAIHPLTGQLFITSSVGKVLMVLNPNGQIDHLQRLDKKLYAQPEGLTFDSDGTLYISTEKKKAANAKVYRLDYRPA
ncbi:MAG: SdiA-regulated domain-containing protein [Lewinella sp.]